MHAFDYSGWRPDVSQLKQAGVVGVCRYVAPTPSDDWKRITKAEYDALQAARMPVALVWEDAASSWTGGYSVGFVFGRDARAQARALGFPDSRPIYVAVDTDVTPAMLPTAVAHVRGFVDAQALGPQGVYAEGAVIDACFDAGLIRCGWEAAASSWSAPSARASIRQHITKSYPQFPPLAYDENTVLADDWGQHPLEEDVAAFTIYKDVRGQHWRVAADGLSRVPTSGFPLQVDQFNSGGAKIVVCDANLQTWLDTVPNLNVIATTAAAVGKVAESQAAMVREIGAVQAALSEVKDAVAALDLGDGVDLTPITSAVDDLRKRLDGGIAVALYTEGSV